MSVVFISEYATIVKKETIIIGGDFMTNTISAKRKSTLDKLYHAFEVVSEGSYVYLCDMKYDFSKWSAEAVQYFDLPSEYMYQAGDIWEQHIHPDDKENYHQSIADIFSGTDKGHDMQYRARDRMGRYVVCTCRGTVLLDADGSPDYFVGCIRNHGLVNSMDSLTGFQNQFGLFEHLNVLYSKQSKANIMMIGVGHFATVNEMWGYDFGNLVIHKLVQLLKERFRNEGVLYRVSGVTFVLLSSSLSLDEMKISYESLREEISEKLVIDGYRPNLRIYGSAMEIKEFQISPQAMFSCLEYAYNISKERKNGSLHIFNDEADENRTSLLTLINAIRKSIVNDCQGFMLYYQPIMNAKTGTLYGAEALLRWQTPAYGLVPPNRFIPIIENDPAFVQLGEWILRKALTDMKPVLDTYPDFEINVNVSFEQLRQDSFVSMVKQALDETGFSPRNLCLEITERCRLLDMTRLSAIVSDLRSIGVLFAIDDFGTGYSSMDILNQLKCEVIKVDKSFIDNVAKDANNAKLITVVSSLADIYGSKACVEGVETEEQCRIVKECGVSSIQGYYYSRPLPLNEFIEKLQSSRN